MEDPSVLQSNTTQIDELSNPLGGESFSLTCNYNNYNHKNVGGTSGTLLNPPDINFAYTSNGIPSAFNNNSKSLMKELDILVQEMSTACSLSNEFFNELAAKVKSEDPNERCQATHILHRSLKETLGYKTSSNSMDIRYPVTLNGNSEQGARAHTPNFKSSLRPYEAGINLANTSDETPIIELTSQKLIENDLIPHFMNSLSYKTHISLISESISLLALIFSNKNLQLRPLANPSFVNNLIDILNIYKVNFNVEIRNNIFAILAIFASHSIELRDLILHSHDGIRVIVDASMLKMDVSSISACSDIFFSYRLSHLSDITLVLEFFTDCFNVTTDTDMITIICRAYIKVIEDLQYFGFLYNYNVVANLMDVLKGNDSVARFEALSVFSKIAFQGNRDDINYLIKHDIINVLVNLLENSSNVPAQTRSRTCNLLGNIGYETDAEVQLLIEHNVYPKLINIFRFDPDLSTRAEAAYAVCTGACRANCQQVGNIMSCTSTLKDKEYKTHNNCMKLIADMLEHVSACNPHDSNNLKLCLAILKGLSNVLEKGLEEGINQGLRENPYAFFFRSVQGHIKLAQLQYFPELNVVNTTNEILSKYFANNS